MVQIYSIVFNGQQPNDMEKTAGSTDESEFSKEKFKNSL